MILMVIWQIFIIIFVFFDFGIDYIYLYFVNVDSESDKGEGNEGHEDFLYSTYYFVGVMYFFLSILIVWQSLALISIMKIMGNRLAKEKKRLKILMIVLAISYVGTSLFYLIQVSTDLNCTRYDYCSRFTNVMARCAIQFFFDIIPIAILYFQHY